MGGKPQEENDLFMTSHLGGGGITGSCFEPSSTKNSSFADKFLKNILDKTGSVLNIRRPCSTALTFLITFFLNLFGSSRPRLFSIELIIPNMISSDHTTCCLVLSIDTHKRRARYFLLNGSDL